jgi:penicillin-binding protein 1B
MSVFRRPAWMTRRRVRVTVRWAAGLLGLGATALFVVYGVALVDSAFRSGPGTPSTVVLSAPLVLSAGEPWSTAGLVEAMTRRGVRRCVGASPRAAEIAVSGPAVLLGPALVAEGTVVTLRPGASGLVVAAMDGRLLASVTVLPAVLGTTAPGDVVCWPTRLEDMAPSLLTAVVDVEDRTFLTHGGLSLRGLLRAAWRDLVAGGTRQGGSTITQQLAKVMMLKPARTVPRKVLEAWLAALIEYRYDKRTILESYLNRIYLGQDGGWQIQGVAPAAHFYFGKRVGTLEPEEAALLAGLIAAPNRFDPFAHPDAARGRRGAVLQAMLQAGHLDPGHAELLARSPLPESPRRLRWPPAAHALDLALEGSPPPGALRTSLDPDVQVAVSSGCDSAMAELERRSARLRELAALGDPVQVGAVVMSPDGRILGLRGSRAGLPGELDRVTAAHRPVGSLVKPFVVATAFLKGWSADSPLQDEPLAVTVGKEVWEPRNNNGRFRGVVSVREALVSSLNVPMVRLGLDVGVERVVQTLRDVGFTVSDPAPATLLGALAATPLQMAAAYAVFASKGALPRPALKEALLSRPRPVLDPSVARSVLALLEEVPRSGTAASLAGRVEGRLGCKTGTTDDRRDSWFAAVRPRCVVVVWVGSDANRETGLYGATGALEVFRAIDARLPAVFKQGDF